jgi:hypothetical protein
MSSNSRHIRKVSCALIRLSAIFPAGNAESQTVGCRMCASILSQFYERVCVRTWKSLPKSCDPNSKRAGEESEMFPRILA